MQKILTMELLERLISQGYRYCLSRTMAIIGEDADVCITLTPIKKEPSLKDLAQPFNMYYHISEEPKQMAISAGDKIVMVDLSEVDRIIA